MLHLENQTVESYPGAPKCFRNLIPSFSESHVNVILPAISNKVFGGHSSFSMRTTHFFYHILPHLLTLPTLSYE
jgi:hypothetical protein